LRAGLNEGRKEKTSAEDDGAADEDGSFTRMIHSQPPDSWADIYVDEFSIEFSGAAFQHKV
jgi:hypothetical protein